MEKQLLLSLFLILAAAPAVAQEPAGFRYWTGPELQSFEQKLAQKSVNGILKKDDNCLFAMVHREQSSPGEAHGDVSDTYIVQTGEATLVVGGEIPNAKTSASGEVCGDDITGGARKKLVPGVVAHIPVKMNHQILVAPGKQVTYMIIKINVK